MGGSTSATSRLMMQRVGQASPDAFGGKKGPAVIAPVPFLFPCSLQRVGRAPPDAFRDVRRARSM